MTQQTIVQCPVCEGSLFGSPEKLFCRHCHTELFVGTDGFFDFRNQREPRQKKGLRVDMHFGCAEVNPFGTFLQESILGDIYAAVTNIPMKTVLDIGCGDGNLADLLLQNADSYYGMEPSEANAKDKKGDSARKRYLIHNDVEKSFPIADSSVDAVTLFASYDHLPFPRQVLADALLKLKEGGYLIITMSNYGFWIKSLLNQITGKQMFRNEQDHFCVHSPTTLTKEIHSFFEGLKLRTVISDSVYLPNLPGIFSRLYFSLNWVKSLNMVVKKLVHITWKTKYRGSNMVLVFEKCRVAGDTIPHS